MTGKIAYILSRFPKVSETFILREINTLEGKGWEIELYPLILEKEAVVHSEAKPWLEKLHYFPWLSMGILSANTRSFFHSPIGYIMLWGRMVLGNVSNPKFLVRSLLLFPKAIQMAEEMHNNGIQHIHAHYATYPTLAAWIIYNLTDIPYSVTVHAHDIYVTQTMLAKKLKASSFIIAISEFNRRFLRQHIGSEIEDKIKVVHCGIDSKIYALSTDYSVNWQFQLISIGSLQDYKGFPYLIEACALLVKRNIPIHCEIIGEGEKRNYLEKLINEHSLKNVVYLAGAKTQAEVAKALSKADCYVQPSIITKTGKMEGIPVAIMEALSSGLPVIASDISGISEIVRPGGTGYLVPEKSPSKLADALEFVFRHPQDAMRLVKNGQELVAEEFNLNKNIARVAHLFENFHDE